MDKQLLKALENLGDALELLALTIQNKGEAKSDTAQTIVTGDFGKSLEQINNGIKSIKSDTQSILKNQQTIISLQKKKDSDKKTEPIDEAGDPKKKQSLKKGVATILLIAVAVLAIGMAFKLVGKIDFLSVIGLGIAILAISVAFEKVARLKLSIKEALIASLSLVLMSAAITISSWVLKLVSPVGIAQLATAVLIAGMFAVLSSKLENIFEAVSIFRLLRVKKTALILTLVSISAAIAASSWILQLVKPIGFAQAITAILIAGVFAIIAINFDKIAEGVAAFDKFRIKKSVLLLTLVGIATAITMSSWIMSLITPLNFAQALTAILISLVFLIISFNFEKIAAGIAAFDRFNIKKSVLLLTLVGISTAITMSSWIMSLTTPIGIAQFLTVLGIAIIFALMSYVMPMLATGLYIIDKILGKKGIFLFPLVFVAISTAIMLSSHILAMSANVSLSRILKIAAFGIAIAILTLAMLPSVLLVGIAAMSGVGAGAIALGVLMIPLIAGAVAISSHILSMGKYNKYPGLGWAAGVGLVMISLATSAIILGAIAITGIGAVAILAGLSLIPLIADSIVKVDKIIAKGNYSKYPGWKWVLSVGATMTGFGLAVLGLGLLAVTGVGLVAILAGTKLVPEIAKTIVETDKIIAKGKYDKYPGWKWIASVGITMTAFGAAVVSLGILAITGFGLGAIAIVAGTLAVPLIAKTIVETDKIIAKGKYDKYPGLGWALSVGGLMTVFGLAVLTLGSFIVGSLGLGYVALKAGQSAVKIIAQSIVDVAWIFNKNSAAFKVGPSKEWAEGVSIALGAFSPVYGMLMKGGIMKIFSGTGPSPKEFAEAIRTISQGIVDAANFFGSPEMSGIYKGGPPKEWAEGVGKAIGAFAPVYKILAAEKGWFGTGVSIEKFKKAIITISNGIVAAAGIFGKNKAKFEEGNYPSAKWGQGVGGAIKAFAPLFKALSEDTGMFTSGSEVVWNIIKGIKGIASAIVSVGLKFSNKNIDWKSYPTKTWSWNLKLSVSSFVKLSTRLEDFDLNLANKSIKVAQKMSNLAKVLSDNKKYFKTNIPKGFVSKMAYDLLTFQAFVNALVRMESSKSIGGKISESFNAAIGKDPVTQIAKKLITLSKGYDALSRSLMKLSIALRSLNLKTLSDLGSVTRGLVSGKESNEEVRQVRTTPIKTVGKQDDGTPIGSSQTKEQKKVGPDDKKNSLIYVSQQLEKMNKILAGIEKNSGSINKFLEEQATKGIVLDTEEEK